MTTYRISELARRSGVPASTLRFYEQAGLLPADRTPSGYRIYDDEALRWLEFIGSAKLLGLPLEEIRNLVDVWAGGVCDEVRQRLRPLVAARIADAERRIAELTAFAARLADVYKELGGPAEACGPGCGCLVNGSSGAVAVELAAPRPAAERVAGGRDDRPQVVDPGRARGGRGVRFVLRVAADRVARRRRRGVDGGRGDRRRRAGLHDPRGARTRRRRVAVAAAAPQAGLPRSRPAGGARHSRTH